MGRLMDYRPLLHGIIRLEYGVDAEQRDEVLLGVTADVLRQVSQSVLNCLLEGLLEVVIETSDECEPLGLNLRATMDEQVVGLHHFVSDGLERVGELNLLGLQALLLLLDELI